MNSNTNSNPSAPQLQTTSTSNNRTRRSSRPGRRERQRTNFNRKVPRATMFANSTNVNISGSVINNFDGDAVLNVYQDVVHGEVLVNEDEQDAARTVESTSVHIHRTVVHTEVLVNEGEQEGAEPNAEWTLVDQDDGKEHPVVNGDPQLSSSEPVTSSSQNEENTDSGPVSATSEDIPNNPVADSNEPEPINPQNEEEIDSGYVTLEDTNDQVEDSEEPDTFTLSESLLQQTPSKFKATMFEDAEVDNIRIRNGCTNVAGVDSPKRLAERLGISEEEALKLRVGLMETMNKYVGSCTATMFRGAKSSNIDIGECRNVAGVGI
ncbi:hypothetical protein BDQ17DRAFT_1342394 [Cyathus striatus]|nr:hypothetical protein BDQ17DRAFT_1342394 [Cyathus striatus]